LRSSTVTSPLLLGLRSSTVTDRVQLLRPEPLIDVGAVNC
jgi:hypothetical protein